MLLEDILYLDYHTLNPIRLEFKYVELGPGFEINVSERKLESVSK